MNKRYFFKKCIIIFLLIFNILSCSSDSEIIPYEENTLVKEVDTNTPFNLEDISAVNENDFYIDKINEVSKVVNLVDDYNVDETDTKDDSDLLQKAIDDITLLPKGGKIIIPEGTYYFNQIVMKSNVHIVIDNGTILRLTNDTNRNFMFLCGESGDRIENFSVRAKTGRFTIDINKAPLNEKALAFFVKNAQNFMFSDMNVLDNITRLAALVFTTVIHNGNHVIPKNGIVKNSDIRESHVGYGLVQVNAGKNMLFKDLTGEGGVVVRLESGSKDVIPLREEGSIHNMVVRNIFGENCNAAVMISPHSIKNGEVDVDGAKSNSCIHTVRIDRGDDRNNEEGVAGYFSGDCLVKNVHATYGETTPLKLGHFRWIPCEMRDLIGYTANRDSDKNFNGPSAAALRYSAYPENGGSMDKGYFNVEIPKKTITQEGFNEQYQPKKIQWESDADLTCKTKRT
ncbi:glycosyl hydrolase family 28-related protein [Lutibacter citreus]|uniref:glycosyl hydrolase family 28-related protein n=1 Tax=Lutibacter citreus TaxID=2138210 RepID=UPI000DBE8A1B|nr:glycosyl hydrolase family 28-related protein [Lutibacter citreus]